MHINIFRNYDIRGKYPEELDENTAYLVGYYLGEMTNKGKVITGYDGRLSSPSLYKALVSGILESGASILHLGLIPTPLIYFANKILSPEACIMITASHNPKGDNGFKMILRGESFFGEDIFNLRNIITNSSKKYIPMNLPVVETIDISEKYIARILKDININPKLKIAWDPGNGGASDIVTELTKRLPNKNFLINSEIDGNFPNRSPDPTINENLHQLQRVIKENDCDLGIALDGDADRVVFVTKYGQILKGDEAVAIVASEVITENPGVAVIADIKSSQTLFDHIASLGGNPIMHKTGHSIIKAKMQQTGAPLAGELSGHIFFADKYYGYDDGIYAALRMINLLGKSKESLDQKLSALPEAYSTPEIKLPVADSEKFLIIDEIKKQLNNEQKDFIDIDGIRYKDSNGWWILRASNTEAALTARCEGKSKNALEIVKSELNAILMRHKLKL